MIKKRYNKQEILQGNDPEALLGLAASYSYKFGIIKNTIVTNLDGMAYTLEAGSLVRVYVELDNAELDDTKNEIVKYINQVRINSCGEYMQILQYSAPTDVDEYVKLIKNAILDIERSIAFSEEIDKLGDNVLKKKTEHGVIFGVSAIIIFLIILILGVQLISVGVFNIAIGVITLIILCIMCFVEAMLDILESSGISTLFFGEDPSNRLWKKYDKILTTETQYYLNHANTNNLDPQVVQELLAICTDQKPVFIKQDRERTLAITCSKYEPKLPYKS